MGAVALGGRLLFSLYFIVQGVFKYPGPCPSSMSGCNDAFVTAVPWIEDGLTSLEFFPESLPTFEAGRFLVVVGALEVLGGLLFAANSRAGALSLILSILLSSPVMHPFHRDEPDSPRQMANIIHCQKNMALVGALLFWLEAHTKQKRGYQTET